MEAKEFDNENEDDVTALKQAVIEMSQMNEFLQDQVAMLSLECHLIDAQRKQIIGQDSKIKALNILLEDLTAENTRLIIENHSLSLLSQEKSELESFLDRFKVTNNRLLNENEDLRHKFDVAEKLRLDMKEHLHRYITKHIDED